MHKLKVFLCHASGDKPQVRALYHKLLADGFDPWLDEENLLPGQDWQLEIQKAVHSADVVVICLSKKAVTKTGYVQKEIRFALDVADEQPEGTIFLIPAKLEECDVPTRLQPYQWVSLFAEKGYQHLVKSLRLRASSISAEFLKPEPPSLVNKLSEIAVKFIDEVTPFEEKYVLQTSGIRMGVVSKLTPENLKVIGGMEFVRVPAGKFLMGSREDNIWVPADEKPQHTVDIPYDYWIAGYPVTNQQYARFVDTKSSEHPWVDNWQKKLDHPVVNVSWNDALWYCEWLQETLKKELPKELTLRLPNEPEWEKAARGPYGNEWPWGNEFDPQRCNIQGSGKGTTTPVGTYSPQGDSPYGAADMAGNVWEWCLSLYKPYPYDRLDGREEYTSFGERVLRGGAWGNVERYARCTCRSRSDPEDFDPNFAATLGFRLVAGPLKR